MSDPSPSERQFTQKEFDLINDLFKNIHESYQRQLEYLSSIQEKGSEVNRQTIAFYERIMLLSLGTIALSVTALIDLQNKFSTGHFPKHVVLWYVVPAWCLLFICTIASRVVIQINIGIEQGTL